MDAEPQLDGYRPWHVPECPDRRNLRQGDAPSGRPLESSTCSCPPGRFGPDSSGPIWEPGDEPGTAPALGEAQGDPQ
jgi:hypothetical protein